MRPIWIMAVLFLLVGSTIANTARAADAGGCPPNCGEKETGGEKGGK